MTQDTNFSIFPLTINNSEFMRIQAAAQYLDMGVEEFILDAACYFAECCLDGRDQN